MLDLARELARRGHEVRIVTSSPDHDRVDLEAGVWVHRIRKHTELPSPRHLPAVPEPLWPNAGAVAEEVLRISRERPVDVVLSSIWDVEWVGVFGSSSVPVVSAYTTPFSVVRATQPEAVQVSAAVADGIESLERWAHGAAHAVQANGEHIVEAVEQSSGVRFDPAGLFVAPLGSGDPVDRRGVVGPVAPNGIAGVDRPFTVLFVGRFERRKGIDLLLDAIAPVIAANPSVRFVLAGPDDLPDGSGSTHRARFEAAHPDLVAAGSVRFTGPVDGDELAVLLGEADAAVLPSRFESFGLVYVEAMAAGLPVVALADSGAEEVVTAGVTGFLCPPDPEGLAAAILALAADPVEAAELGRRGRGRFEREFTVEAMADRFLALFSAVRARRPGSPEWPADTDRLVRLADGNPGHRLERGEQMRLDVPRGRCTVVVAGLGDADPSSVAVVAGGQEALVEVRGEEFHHVVLRTGAAEVEVSVRSGPPVGLAALVVADAADGVGE
jgi:glycosyltransferase involved in cell wall biosynthesis